MKDPDVGASPHGFLDRWDSYEDAIRRQSPDLHLRSGRMISRHLDGRILDVGHGGLINYAVRHAASGSASTWHG